MRYRICHLYAIVALIAVASSVPANTPQVPLHVGRIWTNPEYDGAEGWNGSILQYPAGIPIIGDPWTNDASLKRGWVGHGQKMGTYLFSTDWTDPERNIHDFAMSYFYRNMNYDYPPDWLPGTADAQFNYLYPGGVQVYRRWPRPDIFVGDTRLEFHPGADTVAALPDNGGSGQYPLDIVDPTLVTEQTVDMWWRYIQGVELRRTQYAYPYGSAHQDYILSDITLTNNGISGTTDEAPVIDGQTLNGVVWVQAFDYRNRYAPNGAIQIQNDNHGKYIEPFGPGGHAAVYFRDGDVYDTGVTDFPGRELGDPPLDAYYNGHLLGNAHVMIGPVFVSEDPAAVQTDLTQQPAFRLIWGERGVDFAEREYSPVTPGDARRLIADGENQMDIGIDMRDDPRTFDFAFFGAGGTALLGYGPLNGVLAPDKFSDHGWTLGFGESVRIVQVMAAGGLDKETAQYIGHAWNARREEGVSEDLLTPEETALVLSGEDTVRKAMNMAYWNMHGQFPSTVTPDTLAKWGVPSYETTKPVGHDPFDVPDAPRPPRSFYCYVSGVCPVLIWSTEAETEPNHDTGVLDFERYRIYRQEGSRLAKWEIIAEGLPEYFQSVSTEGNLPEGRRFIDQSAQPTTHYWYAIVAVNDGSQNWAEPEQKLESSRWWTWLGYSEAGLTTGAVLTAEGVPACPIVAISGEHPTRFALHSNAPNPFNPATTLRFSIADADHVRLVIYDAVGRHVRTIVDRAVPAGEHEIMWDGADATGRRLGSGVYVYRLTATGSDGTVQTATRRMLLVR
jgi:hypothetical protein